MTHPILKRLTDAEVLNELSLARQMDEEVKADYTAKAQAVHTHTVNSPAYVEASDKLARAFNMKNETSGWYQEVLREAIARRDAKKLADAQG